MYGLIFMYTIAGKGVTLAKWFYVQHFEARRRSPTVHHRHSFAVLVIYYLNS